jgi:hypothetical protein
LTVPLNPVDTALCEGVGATVVSAGVVALFVEVVAPPASPGALTAPLKAGGVIERIAPSPVTVPAAINNVFLIPVLSLFYLRAF